MNATRAQTPEMLSREQQHRPHGATWLNGERWMDELATAKPDPLDDLLQKMKDKENNK